MLNREILLILLVALLAACPAPFAGDGSGMSPISTSWAAPGCVDSDNDTFFKYHPKGCAEGTDPDDNDPCVVPEGASPDPQICNTGGGSGDTGVDPYNLARAAFADRTQLGNPQGGVFADDISCGPYDYWDWQESLLPAGVGLDCPTYLNSSNVSGGGRWFLISSAAGSDEVVDTVERWLIVDFSEPSEPVSPADPLSPCYDLDFGGTTSDYSDYGIPLYLPGQIEADDRPCIDNLSIRLSADRILKAKANQQQLEFSVRHRPDPIASIYWSPWGYVSYINPLYLWDSPAGNAAGWTNCRVMSTRSGPDEPHDRAEAELLRKTGAGQTESLGSYNLPMEVCVTRASD